MRKLILLVLFVLPMTIFNSCNEDELSDETQKMNFDGMNIQLNYRYKVNDINEVNEILTGFYDEMFIQLRSDGNTQDEQLLGFYAHLNNNQLTIYPITNESQGDLEPEDNSFLEGWKNEVICYSESCVKKTVTPLISTAFGDQPEEVTVKVIRTNTHVIICSQ